MGGLKIKMYIYYLVTSSIIVSYIENKRGLNDGNPENVLI